MLSLSLYLHLYRCLLYLFTLCARSFPLVSSVVSFSLITCSIFLVHQSLSHHSGSNCLPYKLLYYISPVEASSLCCCFTAVLWIFPTCIIETVLVFDATFHQHPYSYHHKYYQWAPLLYRIVSRGCRYLALCIEIGRRVPDNVPKTLTSVHKSPFRGTIYHVFCEVWNLRLSVAVTTKLPTPLTTYFLYTNVKHNLYCYRFWALFASSCSQSCGWDWNNFRSLCRSGGARALLEATAPDIYLPSIMYLIVHRGADSSHSLRSYYFLSVTVYSDFLALFWNVYCLTYCTSRTPHMSTRKPLSCQVFT